MSTDPEIHPSEQATDTTALDDAITYLNQLHARMADRVFRVTTHDSDVTKSLPKRLKALQKALADETLKITQENATP